MYLESVDDQVAAFENMSDADQVALLRHAVETHHERLRTIEDVARECHVTPMYIARLFRRFARAGAYRFLLRLRMNRAAELLLEPPREILR